MSNPFLAGVKQGATEVRLDDQNTRAWDTNRRLNEQEDRQAAQAELNNKIRGYEMNAQGQYEATQARQNADTYNAQLVEQKMVQQQAGIDMLVAQSNTRDMTSATKSLSFGNVKDAITTIGQNPDLQTKLLQQFNAQNIAPVDWVHDKDLFKGTDMYFDLSDEYLADPKIRAALDSSFFKIIGPDGKSRLGNTQNLVRQTGALNYMTTQDQEGLTNRFNMIGDILKGSVLQTPQEKARKAKQAELADEVIDLKSDVVQSILTGPGTAEEKLAKITGMSTKQMSAKEIAQTTKAQTEAEIALATKDDDIKKARSDALKAEYAAKKAKGEMPVDFNTFNYIDSLKDKKTSELTGEELAKLRAIEDEKNTTLKGVKKIVETKNNFANNFNKLIPEIKKLDYDAVEKIKTAFSKVLKTGSAEDRTEALKLLGFETKLGSLMASYIKEMSGAAVTDSERQLYTNLLKAGSWAQGDAAEVAIGSFVEALRVEGDEARENLKYSNPITYRTLGEMTRDIYTGETDVKTVKDFKKHEGK